MDTTRLGSLAISYELVDKEQLERCLELQETSSPPRYLGEILVAEGILAERTLRRLLSAQRKEVERLDSPERFERTKLAKRLAPGAGIKEYLTVLGELGGQELHLAPGARPTARVHGSFLTLRPECSTLEEVEGLLDEVLDDALRLRFVAEQSANFVYAAEGVGRFRVSLFCKRGGSAALLFRIPAQLPAWEDLRLPDVLREVSGMRTGLVLVAGPRASGKTTTLAALVELINTERRCHVVCLGETQEVMHESKHSLVTQIQVGRNVADWDSALFAALRLDPDVIVLGDLNSPGRLATALRAAETGHLVLGTLATQRAAQTLPALIHGCGVDRASQVCSTLAGLLRLVICQQLVPDQEGKRLHVACEVLRNTPAVANMIRDQRFHQLDNVIRTSREQGMISLDDSLYELAAEGKISAGDAVSRAEDPDTLFARLEQTGGRF
jgi:twitching motility protein PilT